MDNLSSDKSNKKSNDKKLQSKLRKPNQQSVSYNNVSQNDIIGKLRKIRKMQEICKELEISVNTPTLVDPKLFNRTNSKSRQSFQVTQKKTIAGSNSKSFQNLRNVSYISQSTQENLFQSYGQNQQVAKLNSSFYQQQEKPSQKKDSKKSLSPFENKLRIKVNTLQDYPNKSFLTENSKSNHKRYMSDFPDFLNKTQIGQTTTNHYEFCQVNQTSKFIKMKIQKGETQKLQDFIKEQLKSNSMYQRTQKRIQMKMGLQKQIKQKNLSIKPFSEASIEKQ